MEKNRNDKKFSCFNFMNKTNITLDYIKNIMILIVVLFIICFCIYIYVKINSFINDIKKELFEPMSNIKSEFLDFKNSTLYIIDNFENKTVALIDDFKTDIKDIPQNIHDLIKNISIF